jgi:hypothetical protein
LKSASMMLVNAGSVVRKVDALLLLTLIQG